MTAPENKQAFTLIELLAAMAILGVIVLLISQLFDSSIKAWSQGEEQVQIYDIGRSAVDQIAADLSTAVVDDVLPFATFDHQVGGREGDKIYMLALATHRANDVDKHRDLSEVVYYVVPGKKGRHTLIRRRESLSQSGDSVKLYVAPQTRATEDGIKARAGSFGGADNFSAVLAENVYSFTVAVIDENDNEIEGDFYSNRPLDDKTMAKVKVEMLVLADEDWNAVNANAGGGGDLHARRNGHIFHLTATIPMSRK